jgi:2-polyprenyl-6-methoxyphenol hydroxylase-like FAD-dependent oxidoreductase
MMNIGKKDVIVVGAGPVGLFLARELVRHGHEVLLVEKNARQSEHSKALAVMPRTMEVFEMAGIAAPFAAAAHVVTKAAVISGDRRLGVLPIEPASSGYPYVAMIPQEEPTGDPELALVQQLLDARGLSALRATRLIWSSNFKIHHRRASHMRAGRAFLAGDAAHIHSPFGAQGMNTGLQDAWNLAWKLRLALAGVATPELLESYSAERHEVAGRVIRVTDTITKAMASRSRVAQAIRTSAIPILTKIDAFKKFFVETLTELSIGYPHSQVVHGKGRRAENEPLAGNGRLYSCLGSGFVLLTPQNAAPFDAVVARYSATVARKTHLNRDGIRLIRPDGYIAFESDTATASDARQLEQVLQKQVRLSDAPVVA